MPGKLKVAVTGLGVSRAYIPRYVEAPETEMSMVHDLDETVARETAERFEVPNWTVDFDELLASGVDVLDVSTPNQVHRSQTVAALEAGINVLCQKPMAPTVADCKAMVDAGEASSARLGMFMTWRDDPYSDDLKRVVDEGYIGKLAAVRVRNAHRGPYNMKDKNHWRAAAANIGGGSFMQLAVHPLNYALWLVGEDVASVSGYAKNLHCQHSMDGEDLVAASGELSSGALITMESGYSSTGRSIEVYGTEGSMLLSGRNRGMTLHLAKDFAGELIDYKCGDEPETPLHIEPGAETAEAVARERNGNRGFCQAILSGGPLPTSPEVGMRDVAICQAVYRAAECGRRVEVAELLDEA